MFFILKNSVSKKLLKTAILFLLGENLKNYMKNRKLRKKNKNKNKNKKGEINYHGILLEDMKINLLLF